jgi:hypothetical protein
MIPRKKLQVFVSSTYADLRHERQAAVEAILSAGHIPAGMELFAAGDKSQMEVIKRWINESDVFLLILGGRYGSIEPTEGKSYIQLEYEYAQERGKPFFAVVIEEDYLEEKAKQHGSAMLEKEHQQLLKQFRKEVKKKLVRFFRDPRDIKLSIHEKLSEFSKREELVGWIPGDQAVTSPTVAEEMARLVKERDSLRERLSKQTDARYSGLSFDEMRLLLRSEKVDTSELALDYRQRMQSCVSSFNDTTATLFHFLCICEDINARNYPRGPLDHGTGLLLRPNTISCAFVNLEWLSYTPPQASLLPTIESNLWSA